MPILQAPKATTASDVASSRVGPADDADATAMAASEHATLAELGLEDLGRLVDAIQERYQHAPEPPPSSALTFDRDQPEPPQAAMSPTAMPSANANDAGTDFDEPDQLKARRRAPNGQRLATMVREQRSVIDGLGQPPEQAAAADIHREAAPAELPIARTLASWIDPATAAAGGGNPFAAATHFAEALAAARLAANEGETAHADGAMPAAARHASVASVTNATRNSHAQLPPAPKPSAEFRANGDIARPPSAFPGYAAGFTLSLMAGAILYAML